jgi:hypothetical protein
MIETTLDGERPHLPQYPLRVFRLEAGKSEIVRMCANHYHGLFTHWGRVRSYLCTGDDCPLTLHKSPRIWKGYTSAEKYLQKEAKWLPICLEITENLELDFRGVFARGQVWELFRPNDVGRKKFPVEGKLLEERDPNTFPSQLDLIPVLRHLYHADTIGLSLKNPMPARTFVTLSEGEKPAVIAQAEEANKPMTDQEWEHMRARLKAKKSPSDKLRNGTPAP